MESLKVGMKVYSYCYGPMTVKGIIDGSVVTGLKHDDGTTGFKRDNGTTGFKRDNGTTSLTIGTTPTLSAGAIAIADRKGQQPPYGSYEGFVVLSVDDPDGYAPKFKEKFGGNNDYTGTIDVVFTKAAYGHWYFDSADSIKDFDHQLENNDFYPVNDTDKKSQNPMPLIRERAYRHNAFGGPEPELDGTSGLKKEPDATGLKKEFETTGLKKE